jgi:hypothetical protein
MKNSHMSISNLTHASWRKSSRSADSANCVETAFIGRTVGVRDSKNPNKDILLFSSRQWQNFIQGSTKYSKV